MEITSATQKIKTTIYPLQLQIKKANQIYLTIYFIKYNNFETHSDNNIQHKLFLSIVKNTAVIHKHISILRFTNHQSMKQIKIVDDPVYDIPRVYGKK